MTKPAYDPATGKPVYDPTTGKPALDCITTPKCGECCNCQVWRITETIHSTSGTSTFDQGAYPLTHDFDSDDAVTPATHGGCEWEDLGAATNITGFEFDDTMCDLYWIGWPVAWIRSAV